MGSTPSPSPELLDATTVTAYLTRRGLLRPNVPSEVHELGGGVSNIVLAVVAAGCRLVVKQALPRLRVAEEWFAKPERAQVEAHALSLAGRFAPGSVPRVLATDPEAHTLVIALAPDSWTNWKADLLSGKIDVPVAARIGRLLATWHRRTLNDPMVGAAFEDIHGFEQLRLDPYLRTVMHRHQDLDPWLRGSVERLRTVRQCLVHGDYSPKNVLVGRDGLWVVDWEVAHFGNPEFDLAFMLNHIMLKAIHRPSDVAAYRACAKAFWDTYCEQVPTPLRPAPVPVLRLLGGLMVARVDGKSPAEYLQVGSQRTARFLGRSFVLDPPGRLDYAWDRLRTAGGNVPA